MQRRTARTLQRLALTAAAAAGAWLAAEGLDHGTAHAGDVPIRVEREAQASNERPGGLPDLVDNILDEVLPDIPDTPAEPTPRPDADDEMTAEPDRPRDHVDEIRDVVEDIVDGVVPPGAGGGDDEGPADPPPAPGTTDPPANSGTDPDPVDPEPAAPPADPVDALMPPTPTPRPVVTNPVVSGYHTPAPYVPIDSQTGSWGEPACDSRGDTPAVPSPGTRDRLASPRGLAGPGPTPPPWGDPCDPDPLGGLYGDPPPWSGSTHGADQLPVPAAVVRAWVLDLHYDALGHDRHDDTLPPGRLTLWPPGPG